MKKLNLGIIGLGRAGYSMHLKELKGKEDMFKVYAVCDVEPDRLQKMNEEYGSKMYSRVEDIVADPDIDIIVVATRSCDHFKHAMTALNAGKTVFLEKPITMNYAEAKKLFDYAESLGGNNLYIRHNRRFEAEFMQVQKFIDSGIIGDVYYIKRAVTNFQRRCDWQTLSQYGGGQLLNWGPHLVDQALRFCGDDYVRLNSYTRQVAATGDCEDYVNAQFVGINGRFVEIEISGGTALTIPRYTVYGNRGTIITEGDKFIVKHLPEGFEYPTQVSNPHTPVDAKFAPTDALEFITEEIPCDTNPLDQTWTYLYEAVANGKEYPIKSEEALKVMEVITEIKNQNEI